MTLPPGPSTPPAVQTLRWLFRPIEFMDSCRRRYGDAFSVKFIGFETPMVMISDPVAIEALYKGRENGLPPGRTQALEPVMGSRSVLLLEGSEHLARRRVMLPPFHGERLRAYESVVTDAVTRQIDSWPLDTAFAIHPRMQAVTLERIREYNRAVDELLFEEIAERRDDPDLSQRDDILSMLVAARFEDGEPMSDRELRDQLITLLLAGHETTATGLAWSFDLLLRNPASLARLRAELAEGGNEYLRAVISESLRLRPVVPLAGRRLRSELRVDGHTLPAATDVTPAIWLTHTRSDLYPEPLAFRPERFLESPPETYGWIPFGGGVRRCLGAAFAEFEMRIVLEEVVRRCELRGARSAPERIARRNITFSTRGGTPVVVTARRAARERAAAVAA